MFLVWSVHLEEIDVGTALEVITIYNPDVYRQMSINTIRYCGEIREFEVNVSTRRVPRILKIDFLENEATYLKFSFHVFDVFFRVEAFPFCCDAPRKCETAVYVIKETNGNRIT